MNESNLTFANDPIDLSQLPTIENINYKPIQKAYRYIVFINNIILFAILFLINTILNIFDITQFDSFIFYYIYLGLSILLAYNLIIAHISINYRGYAIRDKDILYKKGVIFRKIIIIPFNRIQHISVSQSLLERIFKLSKIRIYTAGGNSNDLSISGLDTFTCNEIKTLISNKISLN